jgi:hypothetical protein
MPRHGAAPITKRRLVVPGDGTVANRAPSGTLIQGAATRRGTAHLRSCLKVFLIKPGLASVGFSLFLCWGCRSSSKDAAASVDAGRHTAPHHGDADSGGGLGPDAGGICHDFMTAYWLANGPATACIVGAPNQCQEPTESIGCSGCGRLVQDATQLDALRTQLVAHGCFTNDNCPCFVVGLTTSCLATDAGSNRGTCGITIDPEPDSGVIQ